tara:strand:- start:311 stop:550 length:240 start_codon:yes stop_codon:yes gene_type:complete
MTVSKNADGYTFKELYDAQERAAEVRAVYRNEFHKNVRDFLTGMHKMNCHNITKEEFTDIVDDAVQEFHDIINGEGWTK